MSDKTPQEKEVILIGEKYALRNALAMAIEQVADIKKRLTVMEKYTLDKGTLAFDGVICEEVAK